MSFWKSWKRKMGCHCVLANISTLITRGITYLVEHGYLLALWVGKLEIWLLPPTQAVNTHSKVTSSKDRIFWVLLFAFDMRAFMVHAEQICRIFSRCIREWEKYTYRDFCDIEGNMIFIWKPHLWFVLCENGKSCKLFLLPYLRKYSDKHLNRGFK